MSSDSRQFHPFGAGSSAAVSGDLHAPGIATDELTVTGTNGTLVIQDIRFIVEELELRSSNGLNGCDDDDDNDGDDDAARTPALLAEMRAVYPNFPSRASLVVKGTQNGQPYGILQSEAACLSGDCTAIYDSRRLRAHREDRPGYVVQKRKSGFRSAVAPWKTHRAG
jgi:hypothetical protein